MTTTRPPSTLNDPGFGTDPTLESYEGTSVATDAINENEHPLVEAGGEVGQRAGQLAGRAKEIGFRRADQGRELAADGLDKLAQTIQRVSGEIEQQPAIASLASTVAEQTDRAANYLRTTDARQIVGNVERLARRSPALFLGGAFILGAIASRFIKAASGTPDGAQLGSAKRAPAAATSGSRNSFSATGPGSADHDSLTDGGV